MKSINLNEFALFINSIDRCSGINKKISLISDLIQSIDPIDGCWCLSLLMNYRQKRIVTGRRLRQILLNNSKMPEWLFADCFSQVGDSAETISLLWPQLKNQVIEPKSIINEALKKELETLESCLPLHWWMESMLPKLNNLSD